MSYSQAPAASPRPGLSPIAVVALIFLAPVGVVLPFVVFCVVISACAAVLPALPFAALAVLIFLAATKRRRPPPPYRRPSTRQRARPPVRHQPRGRRYARR